MASDPSVETNVRVVCATIVKFVALLVVPAGVVRLILPVVAFAGTMARICVSERNVNDAAEPLNVTLLAPVKPSPLIMTRVFVLPWSGVKNVMPAVTFIE